MSAVPPSLIIEVLAPPGPFMPGEGAGDLPDSGLGLRKYSEIAARCSLVVAAISHSTRKKAIIAVTKSANATFQRAAMMAAALHLLDPSDDDGGFGLGHDRGPT